MKPLIKRLLSVALLPSIFGVSLYCMEFLPFDITREITSLLMGKKLGYDFWLFKQIQVGSFVTSVAFSPDGKTVLTWSSDKTARLWDVETGKQVQEFIGHEGYITSVAYSPDGKTVLTGSSDKTARLWDVETGRLLKNLIGHAEGVHTVAFSADGNMIATGSSDETVILWKRYPNSDQWRTRSESALRLGTEKELHKLMTPTGQSKV